MLQPRDRARLLLEAIAIRFVLGKEVGKNLDGHVAVEAINTWSTKVGGKSQSAGLGRTFALLQPGRAAQIADETLRKVSRTTAEPTRRTPPSSRPSRNRRAREGKLTAPTARTHRQDAGNQPQDQNEPEQESPCRRQSVRTRYPGGP